MENGKWASHAEKALFIMQTKTCTKDSGSTTSAMATEFTQTKKERGTRASGKMTLNRAKALKCGLRAASTLVNMKTAKSKVTEPIPGLTVQSTKETGLTIVSTEWANTNGRTAVSTMATGTITTCMEWASTSTQTGSLTKANTRKTKKLASASTSGPTAANTKAGGTTENSTASASTKTQAKAK